MKKLSLFLFILLFSCNPQDSIQDHLQLKEKLHGQWEAAAFDGALHEKWTLGDQGWMMQEGHYIENSDTSYSAVTTIQKINGEIILLSIIKNADPKVFKAIEKSDSKIIFENKDYKNPFQVTYEFISDQEYKRSISGYESDSLVTYEFNFKKVAETH